MPLANFNYRNYIKRRLQDRCFPVIFSKTLRSAFLKNTYERMLLSGFGNLTDLFSSFQFEKNFKCPENLPTTLKFFVIGSVKGKKEPLNILTCIEIFKDVTLRWSPFLVAGQVISLIPLYVVITVAIILETQYILFLNAVSTVAIFTLAHIHTIQLAFMKLVTVC